MDLVLPFPVSNVLKRHGELTEKLSRYNSISSSDFDLVIAVLGSSFTYLYSHVPRVYTSTVIISCHHIMFFDMQNCK